MQVKNLSLQAAEFKKYNFLMLNILNCKHFSKVIFCSKFEPKTGVLMKCSVVLLLDLFPEIKPGQAQVPCKCQL